MGAPGEKRLEVSILSAASRVSGAKFGGHVRRTGSDDISIETGLANPCTRVGLGRLTHQRVGRISAKR